MAWVETASLSFVARHESSQADAAAGVLDDLEGFRAKLETMFDRVPGEVAVVIHPRPLMLAAAAPWLPLARCAIHGRATPRSVAARAALVIEPLGLLPCERRLLAPFEMNER